MVPAPINPIPDNNCAGILEGSILYSFDIYSPQSMIKTALNPTNECVLKPAGLFQDDLSSPMIPAKTNPNISLIIA